MSTDEQNRRLASALRKMTTQSLQMALEGAKMELFLAKEERSLFESPPEIDDEGNPLPTVEELEADVLAIRREISRRIHH